MIHLNRDLVQQLEIVNLLSCQTKPLSSKEISKSIGEITSSTVLNYCKILKEEIETIYPDNDLRMSIDNQGIFLENRGVTLTKLKNYLLSSDLSYQILYAVLIQNKVDTYWFCLSHGTSHSTLRRKIGSINSDISKFGFHIYCANNFFIEGEEIKLRNFFSIFLWIIHRKFSDIPDISSKNFYLDLADSLLTTNAAFSYEPELLSFFLYTTDLRVKNGHIIEQTEENDIFLRNYICNKPMALSYWQESDYTFMRFSYFSHILKDPEDLDYLASLSLSSIEDKLIEDWIKCFNQTFGTVSPANLDFVRKILKRNIISERMLKISTNLIPLFVYDDFNIFKKEYKFFCKKFDGFFRKLYKRYPELNNEFYRNFCFYICLVVLPPEQIRPKIKVFCLTDYTYILNRMFEYTLETKLVNQYILEFSNDPDDADLIISNLTMPDNLKHELDDRHFLLLENPFSDQNLDTISKAMTTISLQ